VLGRFYAAVRKVTPQMRVMAELYGGDVSFNFDSNGRSVWVMAVFGKDAPPLTPSILRDGATTSASSGSPAGLLRVSGIWPEGPP